MSTAATAAFLIIGNEVLSGRTQDKNLHFLANKLTPLGIRLREVRVVPDVEAEIGEAVRALSAKYTYVFTSGGIGATHDDITTDSIAKAFGVNVIEDAEALERLTKHYPPGELNDARRRMARIPLGASLIDNPVSAAPGFKLKNVHVMAGVPSIFQAMVDNVVPSLRGGVKLHNITIVSRAREGDIADALAAIQNAHNEVEIGSYQFIRDGRVGASFVVRGEDNAKVSEAARAIQTMLSNLQIEMLESPQA